MADKKNADDAKYFRGGFGVPMDEKPELDRRLAEVGLDTAGKVILAFLRAPNAVEQFKPIVQAYLAAEAERRARPSKKDRVAAFAALTPEQQAKLLELAEQQAAGS